MREASKVMLLIPLVEEEEKKEGIKHYQGKPKRETENVLFDLHQINVNITLFSFSKQRMLLLSALVENTDLFISPQYIRIS